MSISPSKEFGRENKRFFILENCLSTLARLDKISFSNRNQCSSSQRGRRPTNAEGHGPAHGPALLHLLQLVPLRGRGRGPLWPPGAVQRQDLLRPEAAPEAGRVSQGGGLGDAVGRRCVSTSTRDGSRH
jgi:hypothetical protein